jgi:hypothetical protein
VNRRTGACRNYGNYLCNVVVIPVVKYACIAFLNMCDSSSSIDYDILYVVEFMIDAIGSHILEVCYGSVTRHNM